MGGVAVAVAKSEKVAGAGGGGQVAETWQRGLAGAEALVLEPGTAGLGPLGDVLAVGEVRVVPA